MLFKANFTKLADDQLFTALAWDIAALKDADDPRARAKEQGCSPRPAQDIPGLCLALALLSCHQLLTGTSLFAVLYLGSVFEHSEQARAPHTNGPRDVPRYGALSLLQKALHYKGG